MRIRRTGTRLCETLLLVCSLSFGSDLNAQASRPVVVTPDFDKYELGLFYDVLEDPSGDLTVGDIMSSPYRSQFEASDHPSPGYGFTGSAFWVRFSVENPNSDALNSYLEVKYPLIDYIDLYISEDDGTFEHRVGGDRMQFSERLIDYRNVLFNIRQAPSSVTTYYVRLESSSSMSIGMTLWSVPALSTHIIAEMAVLGIYHGGILVIIVINLLLFVGFRDKTYLLFVVFMSLWELAELSLNGLAFQYLWPNQIVWANNAIPTLVFATLLSVVVYANHYLKAGDHLPRISVAMRMLGVVCAVGAIVSLFAPYRLTIISGSALTPVLVTVILVAAAMSVRSQPRPALFFLVGWTMFLAGVVVFSLKSFGFLPNTFITHWGMQIGTFSTAIVFSLAMVDQIHRIQKDKLDAQAEALESQQNLVGSLKESEVALEWKVNERTAELASKNEELESSYQKLTMLSEIGQKITSTLDAEQSLDLIYENINRLMDLSFFALGTYRPKEQVIRFGYAIEHGERVEPLEISMDDATYFAPIVVRNRSEIVMNDFENDRGAYLDADFQHRLYEAKSMVFLPMSMEDRVIGVVVVASEKRDAFGPAHLEVLRTLATYGAISIDNTNAYAEIKKAHENLGTTQAQLIQSEKMASLGELTAGIAHEIKNPLNFVNNFAKLTLRIVDEMEEELSNQKDQVVSYPVTEFEEVIYEIRENAEKILEHGKRADGIVKSMLLHSRGKPGERRETDINALVGEYVDLAYHGMRATHSKFNASIEKDFDKTIMTMNVVSQDLGRVFVNLFNNAFYAIHERARMEKTEDYSPTLRVSTRKQADGIEIVIWDNGPGIPEDLREKIFEPFFSTKPTGSGTGLGLSLCFEIVSQMHGGTISVDSREKEYTEFVITLPAS